MADPIAKLIDAVMDAHRDDIPPRLRDLAKVARAAFIHQLKAARPEGAELVRGLQWDAEGLWWRYICTCGAQLVIVPPELPEEARTEDCEPSRDYWHLTPVRCPWCGDSDTEEHALHHIGPEELLR